MSRGDSMWRDTLQRFDLTLGRYEQALEVLQEAQRGVWIAHTPPEDGDSAEVLLDVLCQVPRLIARIRELEAQAEMKPVRQRDPDAWPPE